MKRVLTFILVLSMVLGSVGMVFADSVSDIAGHKNEKAILRLNKLGIVEGDDRGFAPDDNITRAEFAVMVIRALGLEGSANVSKGDTAFTDVTVAAGYEWASGAINVATKLGYIQGYGGGLFGPADNIRYEDAVTLIVRVLGYEPIVQTKGGYPVGYLVVAEQDLDITDHVDGIVGVAITRGAIFQLLDNSLTKPLMIQVGYGADAKYVVSGQKGTDTDKQTILTDRLGIEEVEGRVTANFRVDKLKANEIKITDEDGKTVKYKVSDELDVDALLGLEIVAWEDKDEVLFRYELETDEGDIFYDAVASVDRKEVELIAEDDEFDWAEDGATVYVNNELVKERDYEEDIPEDAYGRFVLDEYGDVIFAYLFEFDADMVGMVLKVKDDEIEFISLEAADEDSIALDDAEEIYVLNADFTAASLDDIEEGNGIFVWIDKDDDYYIVINDDIVEGNLDSVRVRDYRITVDGKNISAADNAIFSDDEGDKYYEWGDKDRDILDLVDEEVAVVLNLVGDAMVLTTDAKLVSSTIYGVATYVTEGRNPVLTVYTDEGKEIDYDFEERADARALFGYDFLGDDGKIEIVAVEFKLNKDGEIAEGELDFYVDKQKVEKDSDNSYIEVGSDRYYVRQNTIVIKALNNKGKLKPSLIKYKDIIDRKISSENAIVIGKEGRNANLIVFTDGDFEATDDTQYGLVTGDVSRKGGDYIVEIDVAGEGKDNYIVSARGTVAKGDLIKFTLTSKGEVKVETKFNADDKDEAIRVADKDGDYLLLSGDWNLVDSNTVIYQTNNKGKLDGTTRLSRISDKDTVVYLEDEGVLKVLVAVTKYYSTEVVDNGNGDEPDPPVIDKTALNAAKVEAGTFKEGNYTAESWAGLTAALALPEDTQEEVDAKTDAINAAIDGLEELTEPEPEPEITAIATPTLSGIGKNLKIEVEGYEGVVSWKVAKEGLGDLVSAPVAIEDTQVVMFVEVGDEITVTLYDVDGEIIAEELVEVK